MELCGSVERGHKLCEKLRSVRKWREAWSAGIFPLRPWLKTVFSTPAKFILCYVLKSQKKAPIAPNQGRRYADVECSPRVASADSKRIDQNMHAQAVEPHLCQLEGKSTIVLA